MEAEKTLWWATANPAPKTAPLAQDLSVDVAVVGGGFTGLTAAWHLARRGVRVVVLEASALGMEASGLNAGFVVPNFAKAPPEAVIGKFGAERGERLLRMIGQGADRVFETVRQNGISCDAEQNGWMHVAHSRAALDRLAGQAAAWRKLGRPVHMLDAGEAKRRTGLRLCAGALIDRSGGMLHPLNYLYGLAGLVLGAGGIVHTHSPAERIEPAGSSSKIIVGGHTVTAGKMLMCTHAGSVGAARPLSRVSVPLFVYQIATEPLPQEVVERFSPERNPIADTRANLFTFRLDRDNRLISGAMAMIPFGAHQRMARMVVERLARELDLASVPKVDFVWRGRAAMAPDFLPHLYQMQPGVIGAVGCNGRGVALTAMLGEVLADAACGTPLSDLPVPSGPLRPIPFHALVPVVSSLAIGQARFADRKLTASRSAE
ncbi:oxidoreductase [Youhaiella tibetensis]|nr:oxidoreductase [Youhaiella tibetensis]